LGAHGHGEDDIRYARRRYLSAESAPRIAIGIANATFAARRMSLWGTGSTAVASDSMHFGSFDQNIFTEWHSRYGGRAVLIYWHVEKGSVVIHSQLLNCSASEVHAMVDGAIRRGTTWLWKPITLTRTASRRSDSASRGCSASTSCLGSSGSTR
jgi:TnpA family transposase